jgi:hypothetical protein
MMQTSKETFTGKQQFVFKLLQELFFTSKTKWRSKLRDLLWTWLWEWLTLLRYNSSWKLLKAVGLKSMKLVLLKCLELTEYNNTQFISNYNLHGNYSAHYETTASYQQYVHIPKKLHSKQRPSMTGRFVRRQTENATTLSAAVCIKA